MRASWSKIAMAGALNITVLRPVLIRCLPQGRQGTSHLRLRSRGRGLTNSDRPVGNQTQSPRRGHEALADEGRQAPN
jgi:hypothetical protein